MSRFGIPTFAAVPEVAELAVGLFSEQERFDNQLFGTPQTPGEVQFFPSFEQARQISGQTAGVATDTAIDIQRSRIARVQRVIEVDRRQQKRVKIGEIAQFSEETLFSGLQPRDVFDERPPIIKFLDLVDLPRNTLANIAFGRPTLAGFAGGAAVTAIAGSAVASLFASFSGGGLAILGTGFAIPAIGQAAFVGTLLGAGIFLAGASVAGLIRSFVEEDLVEESLMGTRLGALGQRSLFGSDLLRVLGVENKIIRAVVGFGGDVLLDPLTYLSGGGNVAVITARSALGNPIRMKVSKGLIKLFDDVQKQSLAAKKFLPGALEDYLRPLAQFDELGTALTPDLVRAGEAILDVEKGGNKLARWVQNLEDVEGAFRKGKMTPKEFRREFGGLRGLIVEEIKNFVNVADVNLNSMVLSAKAAAAGNIIRDFGAQSAIQFTFPFAGVIANRFPVVFRGASGSIPILKIGSPARIQKVLTKSHGELTEGLRKAAQKTGKTAQHTLDELIGGVGGINIARRARLTPAAVVIKEGVIGKIGPEGGLSLLEKTEAAASRATRERLLDRLAKGEAIDELVTVDEIMRTLEDDMIRGWIDVEEAQVHMRELVAGGFLPDDIGTPAYSKFDITDPTLNVKTGEVIVLERNLEGPLGEQLKIVMLRNMDSIENGIFGADAEVQFKRGQIRGLYHELLEMFPSADTLAFTRDTGAKVARAEGVAIADFMPRARWQRLAGPEVSVGSAAKVFMETRKTIALPETLAHLAKFRVEVTPGHFKIPLAAMTPAEKNILLGAGWRVTDVNVVPQFDLQKNIIRKVAEQDRAGRLIRAREALRENKLQELTAKGELESALEVEEAMRLGGDEDAFDLLRRKLADTSESVALSEADLMDALELPTIDALELADNVATATSRGETLTAYTGLSGIIRQAFMGPRIKRLEKAHADLWRLNEIQKANERPLVIARTEAVKQLRHNDPSGQGLSPIEAIDEIIDTLGGPAGEQGFDRAGYLGVLNAASETIARLGKESPTLPPPAPSASTLQRRLKAELQEIARTAGLVDDGTKKDLANRIVEARLELPPPPPPPDIPIPLPPVPAPFRTDQLIFLRRSVRGKEVTFFMKFDDDIDRMLWEASNPEEISGMLGKARAAFARSWLKATFGMDDSAVSVAHNRVRKRIIAEVEVGKQLGFDEDFITKIAGRVTEAGETFIDPRYMNAMNRLLTRLDRGEGFLGSPLTKFEDILDPSSPIEGEVFTALKRTVGSAVGKGEAAEGAFDAAGLLRQRTFVVQQGELAQKRRGLVIRPRFVEEDAPLKLFPDQVWDRPTVQAIDELERMIGQSETSLETLANQKKIAEGAMAEMAMADDQLAASKSFYKAEMDTVRTTIENEKGKMFYRQVDKLARAQLAFRDITRVGIRLTRAGREVQTLRRTHENLIPTLQRQFGGNFEEDLKNLNKRMGGDMNNDHVLAAVYFSAIDFSSSKLGKSGLMPGQDELLKIIDEIAANPKSAPLLDTPEVRNFAENFITTYERFRTELVERGLIPIEFDPEWTYLPLTLDEAAVEAARRKGIELGDFGAGARFPGSRKAAVSQPFLLHRATNRFTIQAVNPITGAKLFDRGQPVMETIWKGQLKPAGTTTPTVHDVILGGDHPFEIARRQHLLDNPGEMLPGDRFDILGTGAEGAERLGKRWFPEEFMTSPHELNLNRMDYMKRVGLDYAGNIFQTDPLAAFATRTGQQISAMAADTFIRGVKRQVVDMGREELARFPEGARAGTRNINGIDMRQLNAEVIRDSKIRFPLEERLKLLPEHLAQDRIQLWPEDLASEIENFAKTFKEDEAVTGLIKGFDTLLSVWKQGVLLLPRWTTINIIGSAMLGFLAGSKPAAWPRLFGQLIGEVKKVHGIWTHGQVGNFSQKLITVGGQDIIASDLMIQMIQDGVVNSGRVMQEILTPLALANPEAKAAMLLFRKNHGFAAVIGKWFKFNAMIEDTMRAIVYVDLRNQGFARSEAADKVAKFLFDYGDLSIVEKKFGTRIWPFYRWMRNNGAFQIKFALEKPAYASAFPKVLNALRDAFEDEGSLPPHIRPHWMRDQMMIEVANAPRTATFLNLNTLTPAQELFEYGQLLTGGKGIGEMLRYVMSGTNPLIKNLYELATGHEIFSRRKIGPRKEGGALTTPDYLWRQTGVLYEISSRVLPEFIKGADDERDIKAGIIRFLIGGRIQKSEVESLVRTKRFESGETLTRLRFAIRKAHDDEETQEVARLSLEYRTQVRQLWDIGMVDLVPKVFRRLFRREDYLKRVDRANRGA